MKEIIEKMEIHNIFQKQATDSTNEEGEMILLNEDNDKDVIKAKQFNQETESVMKKINSVQEEIGILKNEAEVLNHALVERQERIILRIKDIFNEELMNKLNERKKDQNELSQNFTEKGSDET